jgi:drug/metabolite transporter (DMT)-like permease
VNAIALGLLTAAFFATTALVQSRTVKHISPWSTVGWLTMLGTILVLPLVFASGVPAEVQANWGWLLLAGAGNTGGLLLVAVAYRLGKVGVIAPILSTCGALAAVIAAIMGEPITLVVGILLLVIAVGVVLTATAPDPAPIEHERPILAALLAVCAAVVMALGLYAFSRASGDVPLGWALLPARLIGAVAVFLPLLVTRRLQITRRTFVYVVVMALTEAIGYTVFSFAAADSAAIASVMSSMFAPIAAIAAYLLFRERLGRLQVAGVAVIVGGVVALALARG